MARNHIRNIKRSVPSSRFAITRTRHTYNFSMFRIASTRRLNTRRVSRHRPKGRHRSPRRPPRVEFSRAQRSSRRVGRQRPQPSFRRALTRRVRPTTMVALRHANDSTSRHASGHRRRHGRGQRPHTRGRPYRRVTHLIINTRPISLKQQTQHQFIRIVIQHIIARQSQQGRRPTTVLLSRLLRMVTTMVNLRQRLPTGLLLNITLRHQRMRQILVTSSRQLIINGRFTTRNRRRRTSGRPRQPPTATIFLRAFRATSTRQQRLRRRTFLTTGSVHKSAEI